MNSVSLQFFCNRIAAAGRITERDVQHLASDILADGLACRDDADLLIALDRAVPHGDEGFGDLLLALVVDFAVWGERPTGTVDPDVARWLAASLGNGTGPSPLAARIALAIVQEAQSSDEHFIAFALAARARRPAAAPHTALQLLAA